ncbi:MAG: bifunctional methylenetetrahydrofolate dehydrogenase/methenyltetrahydrofolate cyclohydrolase FolD [Opitutae bacterium]|nr:bifunctional methylenetetrahydrofolate dehydrogenase/methenyltetrahydrofolate cyclohydrolase FolD [Opitutae bacterium]
MQLIDGNEISKQTLAELREKIGRLFAREKIVPSLVVLRVGDDPASVSYVKKKEKTAAEVGIKGTVKVFPPDISREELAREIVALNADAGVNGILVQAPLPPHIDEKSMFNLVRPEKDVDGFSETNLGRLAQDLPSAIAACTPAGIIELLRRSRIETAGKHAVVIGRSLIVGKPISLLLLSKKSNATVTLCHTGTTNLAEISRQADIIVVAVGHAKFLKKEMVKPGAVVIDVGINRIPDATKKSGFRLVGDVDFDEVAPRCSHITPVPGGVGPMTVAMLMRNTFLACCRQNGIAEESLL